ncbi:MAG TPA: aminotransferase class IV [Verrucomicrobiae bacterium]|nr:aminotransferase class IV [Verrucomicrobiae bacterium]
MMIWRDGALIEQNATDASDRGAYLGDGLFETILWSRGRAVRLARHVARLSASAEALGFAAPALGNIETAFAELARAHNLTDARAAINLRLSTLGPRGLDRGSIGVTLSARIAPLAASAKSLTLASVAIRRNETAPSSRHKTLSYIDQIAARSEARALGAEEAVQLSIAGNVASAAAGNLVFVIDDRALTPKLSDGALPGTVRAELLERGFIAEATLTPADAVRASAVAVTNATFGVRSATSLDKRALAPESAVIATLCAAIQD